jgi:hypothetical protein
MELPRPDVGVPAALDGCAANVERDSVPHLTEEEQMTDKDLVALDERELQETVGGDGGVAWGLGYSIGWIVACVDTAIDYYRYQ